MQIQTLLLLTSHLVPRTFFCAWHQGNQAVMTLLLLAFHQSASQRLIILFYLVKYSTSFIKTSSNSQRSAKMYTWRGAFAEIIFLFRSLISLHHRLNNVTYFQIYLFQNQKSRKVPILSAIVRYRYSDHGLNHFVAINLQLLRFWITQFVFQILLQYVRTLEDNLEPSTTP